MALVEYSLKDGVAFITLNRPEKLNAVSDDMAVELGAALYKLNDEPEARIGILSGKGRSFCSGADVKQRQLRPREELERLGGAVGRQVNKLGPIFRTSNSKPLIAAVHGHAYGAGLKMALHCDLIVATRDALFQITETSRGLNATGFWLLLTQRGAGGLASDVALTGRAWTGEEGFKNKMVNRLAEPGEQVRVAEELAREILKNPPLSIRAVVEVRRALVEEVEAKAWAMRPRNLHLSKDFQESARAFVEKRRTTEFEGN